METQLTQGLEREKKKIIQWLCCWHKRVGKISVPIHNATPFTIGDAVGKMVKQTWIEYAICIEKTTMWGYAIDEITISIGDALQNIGVGSNLPYGGTICSGLGRWDDWPMCIERVGIMLYCVDDGTFDKNESQFSLFDPYVGTWSKHVPLPLHVQRMCPIVEQGGQVSLCLFGYKDRKEYSVLFYWATKEWKRIPPIDNEQFTTFYFARRIGNTQYIVIHYTTDNIEQREALFDMAQWKYIYMSRSIRKKSITGYIERNNERLTMWERTEVPMKKDTYFDKKHNRYVEISMWDALTQKEEIGDKDMISYIVSQTYFWSTFGGLNVCMRNHGELLSMNCHYGVPQQK
jgi:hypothetical protein